MDNPSKPVHPHSSNPYTQTLPHNSTNHVNQTTQKSKAMKGFQEFIFKLSETHPNAPLTPAAKTLLHGRLNRFVSEYTTPDHPPYSAMIEKALQELNEKRGSSQESISQYLEKKYDNLPWVHSTLLKQHLEKLCESGEIIVAHDKRYGLPGCLNLKTKIKRKPPRRKWRWNWERERNSRRKSKLRKKKIQQKCDKDEVIEKHHEYDENEQQLTENVTHGEDKSDPTKRLLSGVDGENGVCGDPSYLLTEHSGMNSVDEKEYQEEMRSRQLEIGPSDTVRGHVEAARTQEQREREQSEYSQHELSSHERPPGFESIDVENLPHLGSTELEVASAEECSGSKWTRRQLKRWRRFSEPESAIVTSSELVTSPEAEEYHSVQTKHNTETPQYQQKALDSTPISVKQMHHAEQHPELVKADVVEAAQPVMNDSRLKRDKKCGWKKKNNFKISETIGTHESKKYVQPTEVQNDHAFEPYTKIDSSNLSPTLNQAEFPLPNKQEPQELLQQKQSQQEDILQGKQLCRSPRTRAAKPEVAKHANIVGVLLALPCPEECLKTFYRHQRTPSKRRLSNKPPPEPIKAACTDESQHPPKDQRLRCLLKPKPDAADVETLRVADDCRGQNLKRSGKPADCTSIHERAEQLRMEEVLPLRNSKHKLQEVQPTKQQLGRPPKRRSARLQRQDKSRDTEGMRVNF